MNIKTKTSRRTFLAASTVATAAFDELQVTGSVGAELPNPSMTAAVNET